MHNVFLNGIAWKTVILSTAVLVTIVALIQLQDDDLPVIFTQSVFAQQPSVTTVNVGRLPSDIAIDETKNTIYVANYYDSSISVVDGSTDTVLGSFQVPSFPRSIALDASSGNLYVSHHTNSSISVIDLATKRVKNTIPGGVAPQGLAFDSGNSKLYVANRGSDTIHIINTTNNSVLKTVQVGNYPRDIAINPATNKVYVAVSSYKNHYIAVIDGTSGSIMTKIQTAGASAVSVDQMNNMVYVSSGARNLLYVIDGSTDSVSKVLETGELVMSGVFVVPSLQKVLVTHAGSDTVAVLDASTNAVATKLLLGSNPLEIAVNTSTKKAYVVNHLDNTVSVFSLVQ